MSTLCFLTWHDLKLIFLTLLLQEFILSLSQNNEYPGAQNFISLGMEKEARSWHTTSELKDASLLFGSLDFIKELYIYVLILHF